MIIGMKYKNIRGVYTPDMSEGVFTVYREYDGLSVGLETSNGRKFKTYPLENGKLTEYMNTPLNGYKYYQGRYAFKNNGPLKIQGKYPLFYDNAERRVWINLDRTFTTVPYDYETAIQVEYDRKLARRLGRMRWVEYDVDIKPTYTGSTHMHFLVRDQVTREIVFGGTGPSKRYCMAKANEWIIKQKKRLTERYG